MKIAKEFKWEMGHRLPFNKNKCKNLHGHTYKMRLELEGEIQEDGMVIDYYDVTTALAPLIEELDHSVMVWKEDTELLEALQKLGTKINVVPFQSTAENICLFFLDKVKESFSGKNIKRARVWVFETEDTYAMEEISL